MALEAPVSPRLHDTGKFSQPTFYSFPLTHGGIVGYYEAPVSPLRVRGKRTGTLLELVRFWEESIIQGLQRDL